MRFDSKLLLLNACAIVDFEIEKESQKKKKEKRKKLWINRRTLYAFLMHNVPV